MFSLVDCASCAICKKLLPNPVMKIYKYTVTKSFIDLALTLRSSIHLELVFVYGVSYVAKLILSPVDTG